MTSNGNSGFCIPYTVREIRDKGRGVFADAPIVKGTILWRHVRGLYVVYDERSFRKLVATLSHCDVIYELEHVFGLPEFPEYLIRVFDDGVLINHSRQPNAALNSASFDIKTLNDVSPQSMRDVEDALLSDRFALIAIQDLQVGDELTLDYNNGVEDPPYYDAMVEKFGLSWPWL